MSHPIHRTLTGAAGVASPWEVIAGSADGRRTLYVVATGDIEARVMLGDREVGRYVLPWGAVHLPVFVPATCRLQVRKPASPPAAIDLIAMLE